MPGMFEPSKLQIGVCAFAKRGRRFKIGAIEQMLCEDPQQLAGAPDNRGGGRVGHRWGRTKGKIGFHGGKVAVHRPRVRSYDGHEVALPTWRAAQAED